MNDISIITNRIFVINDIACHVIKPTLSGANRSNKHKFEPIVWKQNLQLMTYI